MAAEEKSEATGAVVGDLMVTDLLRAKPGQSVASCLRDLSESGVEYRDVVAVVERGRAIGLLSAGQLLGAMPELTLAEVMTVAPEPVAPSAALEPAVARLVHQDDSVIVVAGEDGRLIGVVPAERLTGPLAAEHQEDMARLGGYRAGSRSALRAAEEPLTRRLWHRLPWLIVGLAGAMGSVVIVGSFEEELNQVILLAFFVPAVVYMADSVGTQTETLLIRALAANVELRGVVRKELLTGVLLGTTVALIFYPFVLIGWGDQDVALAVSLALLCSCSIATAVAMVLPITLGRLGFDPAFGSGPLATVIQDLLSILIYFAIGVPLAT